MERWHLEKHSEASRHFSWPEMTRSASTQKQTHTFTLSSVLTDAEAAKRTRLAKAPKMSCVCLRSRDERYMQPESFPPVQANKSVLV